MIIYVADNGNPAKLRIIQTSDRLGLMFTPTAYRRNYKHRYALDNGAFNSYAHGTPFDDGAFLLALKKHRNADFVVIPDIVAGGRKSLEYSMIWRDFLPDAYPWYLAVQDGMFPSTIPSALLKRVVGLFVGGSMLWKMKMAEDWVDFGHGQGLKVHVGRIGTLRGILWAERIGADSVDSSNFVQNKRNWDELIQWLKGGHEALEEYAIISS